MRPEAAALACALALMGWSAAEATQPEPGPYHRMAGVIEEGVAAYDEAGLEGLTRESSDEHYLFVLDREGLIVAHGSDPALVGVSGLDLVDADKTIEEINAELDSEGSAWVEYRFANPATGAEEMKRSRLVLHDGYAFGSGVYMPIVRIGAIAPLSGGAAGYGAGIMEAMELAVADFNAREWRLAHLVLEARDSATSAEEGARAFAELHDSGVRVFAGPSIDDSVELVMQDPRSRDSVLFSCCSVTVSHSQPDTLFRAVPDHSNHGEALAAVVAADGPAAAITVGRDDPWITELFDQTEPRLESAGTEVLGRILYGGADYDPAVAELASALEAACEGGCPQLAVIYVGFEETAGFVEAASSAAGAQARWFGADANTVTPPVSGAGAEFAEAVRFTSVQPAMYENLGALDGLEGATVYSASAYNSVMALGNTIHAYGTDPAAIRGALPGPANGTVGESFELNENGDLAHIKYAIWEFSDGWRNASYYDRGSIVPLASAQDAEPQGAERGGGCLVATAAYGTELAPAVQKLREARQDLAGTGAGAAFLTAFNAAYYSFSPALADLERQSPVFRQLVGGAAAPMIYTLGVVSYAQTEAQFVALGALALLANAGIYAGAPAALALWWKKNAA